MTDREPPDTEKLLSAATLLRRQKHYEVAKWLEAHTDGGDRRDA